MKNQSKKLKELKESADSTFQEAWGIRNPIHKKKEESGNTFKDDVLIIDSAHRVIFPKTNSTIENPLPNYGVWTEIDWSSSNFSWMVNAGFKAKAAQIEGQGSSRKVVAFKFAEGDEFNSGDFRGGKFIRGVFAGNSFVGQFGPGAQWAANPFAFVDGTTKEVNTILGMKNITNINSDKFKFNIMQVVPGNKIEIHMQDKSVHEISILKRLDGTSSIFQFQVKNGETKKVFKLSVKWSYLRGNSEDGADLVNNTAFSNTKIPVLFTDKFKLGFKSPIVKVVIQESTSYEEEVIEKGNEGEKSSEELAKSQESFDLSKAPLFGITDIKDQPYSIPGKRGMFKNNIGRVNFNFRNNDQLKGFQNTIKNLESKVLRADLTQLKSYLKNNVINGAPAQYPYLANLIGSMELGDGQKAPELDQNFTGSLQRIESLLRDFVDTMVFRVKKKEGITDVSNERVKEMAKDGILKFLGREKPAAAEESAEETAEEPVAQTAVTTKPLRKPNVREAVRDIISKNLKHL